LQQRLLNEPYSGGIGSYTLLIMIISFLQLHRINRNILYDEKDLGFLLIDFFEFYGTQFNYYSCGISIRDGGQYFSKKDRGWENPVKPYLLAAEDPHDIENDVGRNSFSMLNVRTSFSYAFYLLRAEYGEAATPLSRILYIDPKMEQYRQHIRNLYYNLAYELVKRSKSKEGAARLKSR